MIGWKSVVGYAEKGQNEGKRKRKRERGKLGGEIQIGEERRVRREDERKLWRDTEGRKEEKEGWSWRDRQRSREKDMERNV